MKKLLVLAIFLLCVPVAQAQVIGTARIGVPAVDTNGTEVMTYLEVELVPGKGRVLLSADPLTGIQTQDSERIATQIAQNLTGLNFSQIDTIYTFYIDADVIEGPSAGAAMTVATVAAAQNKEIRGDASITGSINSDGTITAVGGVLEKAHAAAIVNNTYFLIPMDNEIHSYYVETLEQPAPGWQISRLNVEKTNVTQHAADEWNLTVLQVRDIYGALEILVDGKNATTLAELAREVLEEPWKVQASPELRPMAEMAGGELDKAAAAIDEAREALDAIPEIEVETYKTLLDIIDSAESQLEKGRAAMLDGSLYGAANHGFAASIDAKLARDYSTYESYPEKLKVRFLGNRISEVGRKLDAARIRLENSEMLVEDEGAFEWAVAAQERFAQADEQYSTQSNDTSAIFYSLAIVESWVGIAESFYDIAEVEANGVLKDLSIFESKSEEMLNRLEDELPYISTPGSFGSEWRYRVAERLRDEGWYAASYTTSGSTVARMEATVEFNLRTKEGIVGYVDGELTLLEESGSIWSLLYSDYAGLLLGYAVEDQDLNMLKEALVYTRMAEVYESAYKFMVESPSVEIDLLADVNYSVAAFALVLFLVLFGLKALHREKKSSGKKKKK